MKPNTININDSGLYDWSKQIETSRSVKRFITVCPNPGEYLFINVDDFISFLFEAGDIDDYQPEAFNGEGMVLIEYPGGMRWDPSRDTWYETAGNKLAYTFQQFLDDCVCEQDLIKYLKSL